MILLPRLFNALCRYWEVPPEAGLELWQALEGAVGTKPGSWRAQLLTFGITTPEAIEAFVRAEMPPTVVIEALEALVGEAQLTRQQATRLENHVLRRVKADGTWHS